MKWTFEDVGPRLDWVDTELEFDLTRGRSATYYEPEEPTYVELHDVTVEKTSIRGAELWVQTLAFLLTSRQSSLWQWCKSLCVGLMGFSKTAQESYLKHLALQLTEDEQSEIEEAAFEQATEAHRAAYDDYWQHRLDIARGK